MSDKEENQLKSSGLASKLNELLISGCLDMTKRKRDDEYENEVKAGIEEPQIKRLKLLPLTELRGKVLDNPNLLGVITDFLTPTDTVKYAATEKKKQEWLQTREWLSEHKCARCNKVFDDSGDLTASNIDCDGYSDYDEPELFYCNLCMPYPCAKCEEYVPDKETQYNNHKDEYRCGECMLGECEHCGEEFNVNDLNDDYICSTCEDELNNQCTKCTEKATETFEGEQVCDACHTKCAKEYARQHKR
jgi:hypothetical protein